MPATYRKTAAIAATRGDGTPDADALAAINALALRELAADEVYSRQAIIAHSGIDRDRESISDTLLDALATSLPGKGFFVSHPGGWSGSTGPGEGRWYRAWTERMSLDQARAELGRPDLQWPEGVDTATLLKGAFYLPRRTAADLIERIDSGVAGDVSIQFTARSGTERRADDGRLIWRQLDAPGEALEASLVWLGAQPGARVTKSARPNTDDEDHIMKDLEARLKAAEDARAAAQAEADKAKAAAAAHAALAKALGDDAGLLEDATATAALVRAGKAHRQGLIDAIVTHERSLGLVGDTDSEVKAAAEAYGLLSTAKLDALAKRYAAQAGGDRSAISGGEPNAAPPRTRSKGVGGYLDNPAITAI